MTPSQPAPDVALPRPLAIPRRSPAHPAWEPGPASGRRPAERLPAGQNLTAVPTFSSALVQRCGGMPEPCPCHDVAADSAMSTDPAAGGAADIGAAEGLLQRRPDPGA